MLDLQHERQIANVVAHAQNLLKPLTKLRMKPRKNPKNNTERKRAWQHFHRAVKKGVLFAGDKNRTRFRSLVHRWEKDGEYKESMEANSFTIDDMKRWDKWSIEKISRSNPNPGRSRAPPQQQDDDFADLDEFVRNQQENSRANLQALAVEQARQHVRPARTRQSSWSAISEPEPSSECDSVATTVTAVNEEPPPWRANYSRASATYQYANYPRGAWSVHPSHGYRGQDPWRNWQAPSGRSQSTGSSNKGKGGRKRPHSQSTGPKQHDNNRGWTR